MGEKNNPKNPTITLQKTNPENPRRIKTICAMGELKKKRRYYRVGHTWQAITK